MKLTKKLKSFLFIRKRYLTFWIFLFSFHTQFIQAQNLSELALFNRCFSQLTSQHILPSDPLFVKVSTGLITASEACGQILDSAKLVGTNTMTLLNQNDLRAQSVLATFQRLHYSWFNSKDFPVISWPGHADDLKDLYDSSSPALYYTRAMLGDGIKASDPVTSTDFLTAIRSNLDPTLGPESKHEKTDFIFQTSFKFASTGILKGIQSAPSTILQFPGNPIPDNPNKPPSRPAGSIDIYKSFGAGFLGTQIYLSLNLESIDSNSLYKTDGAVLMHRRWGKAVYHDTLCRDLPVVRESDALSFVDTSSTAAFRNSSACVKCHASHDRISGVIRGLYVLYIGKGDPTRVGVQDRGGNFARFHQVVSSAEKSWPTTSDSDYFQRPSTGQLFFRNYNGELVDLPLSGISDLGNKIAQTDDYYICLARRYYNFFLGIDVNTADLNDPASGVAIGANAKIHRDKVIALGKNLRITQNLNQMIKEIFKLPNYRRIDFGATGAIGEP